MPAQLAFFGLGKRALRERAEMLVGVPHGRIAYGCDPRKLARDAFSVFDDRVHLAEGSAALWDKDWDASVICAPAEHRARLTLQTLREGRGVLVSLPAALHVGDLEMLREAARLAVERNLPLWPAQHLFFDPFWLWLREMSQSEAAKEELGLIARVGESLWLPSAREARLVRAGLAALARGFDALAFLLPERGAFTARARQRPTHWAAVGSLGEDAPEFSLFAGIGAVDGMAPPPADAKPLGPPLDLPDLVSQQWRESVRLDGSRGMWLGWPQQGMLLREGPSLSQGPASDLPTALRGMMSAFCAALLDPDPALNAFMAETLLRSATAAIELRELGAAQWPDAPMPSREPSCAADLEPGAPLARA
jgi:hypothetical protein